MPHPIAFVGIAEKGSLSLELSVDGEGGHSSMPPTQTAIGVLGAAVGRLEAHPMSGGIHGVARQTLDHVGSSSARSGRPFPTRSSRRRSSSAPPIRGTRISIENYGQCIRFYRELVRGSTSTSSR